MGRSYRKRTHKHSYVIYTLTAAVLLCTIFLTMISLLLCSIFMGLVTILYVETKEEAYENLHVQTKQIKDDITLQLLSDRENLSTMANFAAKLYGDGESYDLLFASFKPIGLIQNIGILNPDNVFVTKVGSIDLDGKICEWGDIDMWRCYAFYTHGGRYYNPFVPKEVFDKNENEKAAD